ncbi:MAG: hypothetical protein JNM84_09260 [Planctomycetes bacterium]|nr:hypothetical protein [Planctomycetota bacterium]
MPPAHRAPLEPLELERVLALAESRATRALDEALVRARYRELRERFVAEDLIPRLAADATLAESWVAFSEARGIESTWHVSRSGELWRGEARERAVRYGQRVRAIAEYIVNELDAVELRLRGAPATPWPTEPWPFDQPIYRRSFRLRSPDGAREAAIEAAYEIAMSAPTSGTLVLSSGEQLSGCSPSFLWSDDGRWLAVPRWFRRFGVLRRQRLWLLDFVSRQSYRSRATARWFQPESFADGRLRVRLAPWESERWRTFEIPSALAEFRALPFPTP